MFTLTEPLFAPRNIYRSKTIFTFLRLTKFIIPRVAHRHPSKTNLSSRCRRAVLNFCTRHTASTSRRALSSNGSIGFRVDAKSHFYPLRENLSLNSAAIKSASLYFQVISSRIFIKPTSIILTRNY